MSVFFRRLDPSMKVLVVCIVLPTVSILCKAVGVARWMQYGVRLGYVNSRLQVCNKKEH